MWVRLVCCVFVTICFLNYILNRFRKVIPFLTSDVSNKECPILINAAREQKITSGLLWHGCHRGSTKFGPENTLEGFKQCIEEPISTQLLEFDVRVSKDKELVLLHDSMMDRTTNKKGNVNLLSLKEILEADAAYFHSEDGKSFPLRDKGIKVPLLKDLLEFLKNSSSKVNLMFDVKDIDAIEDVFKYIKEYELEDRVILGSVDDTSKFRFLKYVYSLTIY